MLRGWFESGEWEGASLSRFLIDQIIETGLEPTAPPPPLPPIDQEEIELLCWMGIEWEGSGDSADGNGKEPIPNTKQIGLTP